MAALLALLGTACGGSPGGETAPDTAGREETMDRGPDPRPPIREVLEEHRDAWLERPEVNGVGIGRCEGEPCIVLYLIRRTDGVEAALPDSVDGYPLRLEVTGRMEPRQPPEDTAGDG